MPRFWQPDRRPLLYPFLAAIYPVLFLAHANAGELIQFVDLYRPVLVALYVALLGSAIGWLVTRDRHRAAVFAVLVVLMFSVHGNLVRPLYNAGLERAEQAEAAIVAAELALIVAAIVYLRRSSRDFVPATRFAAIFVGLLTAYVGVRVALDLGNPAQLTSAPVARPRPPSRLQSPDIYLIVPDKYTGSTFLAQHYGFDNTPLEDSLRARGFVVPRSARANYTHTFLALSAMLNFRYLDDYPQRFGVREPQWRVAYPDIEFNALAMLLKARGYEFVFFPSAWGATRQNRMADRQIPHPSQIRGEFVTTWLHTTIIPAVLRGACFVAQCSIHRLPYVPESAASINWKLEQLGRLDGVRPKFVFAHLTVPHEPYLYARDCGSHSLYWPARDDGADAERVRKAYIEQIQCTNTKLLRLVDDLQRRSPIPPVILIQADHGHGRFGRLLPGLARARPAQVAERLSVFAAYAIPSLDESIPDTITPVNAVRLMLRHTFGEPLSPVEDRSYWSAYDQPYDFTRVY